MALFIVGSYKASPYDPDSAFDPVTHVATESAFIQLLQHGVYDSKYIGYKVQLGNSVNYNNGLWVIADVNHDSANTGQTNCYDLISESAFNNRSFGSTKVWRNCSLRTWLNDTFYPGFGENFKSHLLKLKYYSAESKWGTRAWYTDDYIIVPSCSEANYSSEYALVEGVVYPRLMTSSMRSKGSIGWWTRTIKQDESYCVYGVTSSGSMEKKYASSTQSSSCGVAPLMRVH